MFKEKYKRGKLEKTIEQKGKDILLTSKPALKKRILIADDDPSIREVLMMILERAGYIVELKETGLEILENDYTIPDLFLIDKQLSGLNGLDLCKFLKDQEKTKDIPVLMVSANPDIASLSDNAGADGYIEKPFEMKFLLKKIASHLSPETERKKNKVH